jgi:hypothetical protein
MILDFFLPKEQHTRARDASHIILALFLSDNHETAASAGCSSSRRRRPAVVLVDRSTNRKALRLVENATQGCFHPEPYRNRIKGIVGITTLFPLE